MPFIISKTAFKGPQNGNLKDFGIESKRPVLKCWDNIGENRGPQNQEISHHGFQKPLRRENRDPKYSQNARKTPKIDKNQGLPPGN